MFFFFFFFSCSWPHWFFPRRVYTVRSQSFGRGVKESQVASHPRFTVRGTQSKKICFQTCGRSLSGVSSLKLFSKRREHAIMLSPSLLPGKRVESSHSFITWPIHNYPLKFRGRSPSMNTQRHYCGQKWAGLVNTILFILKKFFS